MQCVNFLYVAFVFDVLWKSVVACSSKCLSVLVYVNIVMAERKLHHVANFIYHMKIRNHVPTHTYFRFMCTLGVSSLNGQNIYDDSILKA